MLPRSMQILTSAIFWAKLLSWKPLEIAKIGKSFVLQGHPGTDKSQAITNNIAECLSNGKRSCPYAKKDGKSRPFYILYRSSSHNKICRVFAKPHAGLGLPNPLSISDLRFIKCREILHCPQVLPGHDLDFPLLNVHPILALSRFAVQANSL